MEERIRKYEASAGSGKTYQLTFQYLYQLIRLYSSLRRTGDQNDNFPRILSSILAITFTNKAANEMKGRILSQLKTFAFSGDEGQKNHSPFLNDLSSSCGISPQKIRELSSLLLEGIILNYNDFNVKTIDSLMAAIIKVISPDLEFPPDFQIAVNPDREQNDMARRFLDQVAVDRWQEMERILSDLKKIDSLQNWQIDQKIIEYVLDLFSKSQYRSYENEPGPAPSADKLRGQLDKLCRLLRHLLDVIGRDPAENGINENLNKNRVRPDLVTAISNFLNSRFEFVLLESIIRKAFFKEGDGRVFLKKGTPGEYAGTFSEAFERCRQHISATVFSISRLRVAHFSDFQMEFSHYWQKYRERFYVAEFSKTLADQFKKWADSAMPYIYLKLSDRYRHFLFDEFQDTSELQFRALSPLIEEVFASEEDASLFLVGDRKQAIYRWRGGEAGLMDDDRLRNEMKAIDNVSQSDFSRTLDTNWRSGRSIVSFNNQIWNSENLEDTFRRLGYSQQLTGKIGSNFKGAEQKVGREDQNSGDGMVQISFLDNTEVDTEFDRENWLWGESLRFIREALEMGFKGAEIAVLTRTNSEGRGLIRFLAQHGIPTISDESLHLSTHPLILEMIAFLRFLDHPPDNLSFYSFISGSIFERAAAAENYPDWQDRIGEFFPGLPDSTPFYKSFQERFPELWQRLIAPLFRSAGFLAPYDSLHDMLQAFSVFQNFPGSQVFLLTFCELIHDLENQEINSISSFLAEWDNILLNGDRHAIDIVPDRSRVWVLTVHKAKGLEFPAVILPLSSGRRGRAQSIFDDAGNFYFITKNYARLNPELKRMYLDELEDGLVDELNLLYVALTRPMDALFVSYAARQKKDGRSRDELSNGLEYADFLNAHPHIRDGWDSETPYPSGAVHRVSRRGETPVRLKARISDTEPREFSVTPKSLTTGQWQRRFLVFSTPDRSPTGDFQLVERGIRIHWLLSQVQGHSDLINLNDRLPELCTRAGLGGGDETILRRFFADKKTRDLFSLPGDTWIEKEIAGRRDGRIEYRRIDRLLIQQDRVLVIDYKTGSEEETDHVRQISEYIAMVNPLFPGRTVYGYLLYVDLLRVKEVKI